MNLGAEYLYSPLFKSFPEPAPKDPSQQHPHQQTDPITLHDIETRRQIAWDIDTDLAKRDGRQGTTWFRHRSGRVFDEPFDLWAWAADQNDHIGLLTKLVEKGADVNYRQCYAVWAAARRKRVDLVMALFETLGAEIPYYPAPPSVALASMAQMQLQRREPGAPRVRVLQFLLDLLGWAPISVILYVLDRFESPVHNDRLFLQYVGRHNRVDVLGALERRNGTNSDDEFVMTHEAACAVFVGAAEGGHMSLLTQMVLKHSVPIDYDSSLALRLSARHIRPQMVLAVLSLNGTLPSQHESRAFALDLLSWGTPACLLALLDRTDARGPHPPIESTPEFLDRLGRCGRTDVLKSLETRRKGWKMGPADAGIVLIGAAIGGHLELVQELVEVYGADPGVDKCRALVGACGSIADSHDVLVYLVSRCAGAGVPIDDGLWGECLIEACGTWGRRRAKIVQMVLEVGGVGVVREYGARAMLEALRAKQEGLAEVVRKAMFEVGNVRLAIVEKVQAGSSASSLHGAGTGTDVEDDGGEYYTPPSSVARKEGGGGGGCGGGRGKAWGFIVPKSAEQVDIVARLVGRLTDTWGRALSSWSPQLAPPSPASLAPSPLSSISSSAPARSVHPRYVLTGTLRNKSNMHIALERCGVINTEGRDWGDEIGIVDG
ncbi:hypothetical protein HK104_001103, partial [Borealophlyctis nickersoniae]